MPQAASSTGPPAARAAATQIGDVEIERVEEQVIELGGIVGGRVRPVVHGAPPGHHRRRGPGWQRIIRFFSRFRKILSPAWLGICLLLPGPPGTSCPVPPAPRVPSPRTGIIEATPLAAARGNPGNGRRMNYCAILGPVRTVKEANMAIPIFQVDAFAAEPFKGNPAGVCLLRDPAEAAWMQSVAAEMNLAETAFPLAGGGRLPPALVHAQGRGQALRSRHPGHGPHPLGTGHPPGGERSAVPDLERAADGAARRRPRRARFPGPASPAESRRTGPKPSSAPWGSSPPPSS